jgi:uncharacterized protein (DUF169 family)
MTDRASLAATLTETLRLHQPPVAIAFTDRIPDGVRTWDGNVPAGCRFWQEAGKSVFATTAKHHDLCAIGTYTHNLATDAAHEGERGEALKVFAHLGYVREADIPLIPVVRERRPYVVYGPLAHFPMAPDVVLLFARSDQSLILTEAAQQMEGGIPPAMGRPACAIVPQAMNTGRTALSLGCCGARAYLDVLTPDVALYAVPGTRISAFTDRVATLARANSILSAFHTQRRRDVESGRRPTIKESLAAMQADR